MTNNTEWILKEHQEPFELRAPNDTLIIDRMKLSKPVETHFVPYFSTNGNDSKKSETDWAIMQHENNPNILFFLNREGTHLLKFNKATYDILELTIKLRKRPSSRSDNYVINNISGLQKNVSHKVSTLVHILVAKAFLNSPQTDNSSTTWQVDHIKSPSATNDQSSAADNLQWVSPKQNNALEVLRKLLRGEQNDSLLSDDSSNPPIYVRNLFPLLNDQELQFHSNKLVQEISDRYTRLKAANKKLFKEKLCVIRDEEKELFSELNKYHVRNDYKRQDDHRGKDRPLRLF